ncbi:MAG: acylneuraminate cytidylyltransferase family protein [Sphingobacteriales bacterium]|nr:MAG: acylneuraminate cytidylyltransferase family protein [Sphingobacteriales bacterium]
MKLIAIIPARGGSKRLPGKNLMDLGGIPLLAHSILYAQAQPQISAVYVTTNDTEIARVAMEFGAGVINRPEAISGDFEPTVSALAHALEVIGESDPVIVLLQPTNPLRPKMLFQECLSVFEQKQTGSLFTVSRNHHKFGTISKERFIPYNYSPGQRSQDLEPLFLG